MCLLAVMSPAEEQPKEKKKQERRNIFKTSSFETVFALRYFLFLFEPITVYLMILCNMSE